MIDISVEGGKVVGVSTPEGDVDTPLVVMCTGPQTRQLSQLAGIDLPIDPFRRMCWITEPYDRLPSTLPMTIDFSSGLWVQSESGGFLFGMADRSEGPTFDKTVDEAWMGVTIEALVEMIPDFEDASVLNGWAGFYEISPDDNPMLGYTGDVEGLVVAAGFSGHGFMQGPAIGACMAELILEGEATTVDISDFRPTRFAEGKALQEHNVI